MEVSRTLSLPGIRSEPYYYDWDDRAIEPSVAIDEFVMVFLWMY